MYKLKKTHHLKGALIGKLAVSMRLCKHSNDFTHIYAIKYHPAEHPTDHICLSQVTGQKFTLCKFMTIFTQLSPLVRTGVQGI